MWGRVYFGGGKGDFGLCGRVGRLAGVSANSSAGGAGRYGNEAAT